MQSHIVNYKCEWKEILTELFHNFVSPGAVVNRIFLSSARAEGEGPSLLSFYTKCQQRLGEDPVSRERGRSWRRVDLFIDLSLMRSGLNSEKAFSTSQQQCCLFFFFFFYCVPLKRENRRNSGGEKVTLTGLCLLSCSVPSPWHIRWD